MTLQFVTHLIAAAMAANYVAWAFYPIERLKQRYIAVTGKQVPYFLECSICLGMWTGIPLALYYENLALAPSVSLLAALIDKTLNSERG